MGLWPTPCTLGHARGRPTRGGPHQHRPPTNLMANHRIDTRPPRSAEASPPPRLATDQMAAYLEDAAHFAGGHARAVVVPRTEAQLAAVLRDSDTVLPVGAQSSLTGGATPMGEVVVSLAGLTTIDDYIPGAASITAQPGVTLTQLREQLSRYDCVYPPVPTFEGATVGGVVSTNAAGAATFKYGTTRNWVRRLSVMLACGELLDLERGQVRASGGRFEIATATGVVTVPVPTYRMPDVPKHSAGYHADDNLDLIDLFIGSEGTLGIVTSVTFDILQNQPDVALVLIFLDSEQQAISVTSALRDASLRTRNADDPRGIDVAAIEHLDRRCLELLREDGADRRVAVTLPDETRVVLLAQLELPRGTTATELHTQVGLAGSAGAPDTPVVRLCQLLASEGLLDTTELVSPDDRTRAGKLFALREAVPDAVNRRVGIAKRAVSDTIEKTSADMIVPFSCLTESLTVFRDAFESRGLDYAIWGHISDANLHPNVIPRSVEDVQRGREAILACGQEIIQLGGSPLAEHGVGRSPVKQALLRQLHGDNGITEMRAVKRALDPSDTLAPGVLFPVDPRSTSGGSS